MEETTSGKTTIAPPVLNTIVRLTTLETPGVSRMAPVYFPVAKSERHDDEGVKIVVKDSTIYVDIYVVINGEENVRVVAETIQQRVTRAISEMVGMDVAYVNVHVTDVDLEA